MKQGCFLTALVCALWWASSPAIAQLPTAQLTSVFPPGGKQGATVEVAVAGSDLDELDRLVFNHPGLTAAAKMTEPSDLAPARPVANQFLVTISGDVPPGVYDVRAAGRFGLSNPRSFVVGSGSEIVDATGNSAADKALDVPLGTTVNGRVDASSYDYFRLSLQKNERALIEVVAKRIDSKLDGTLVLLDSGGRELARVKSGAGADPVLDFTAPEAGAYLVKLYDAVYGGGDSYFYRLTASATPFVDFVFPPCGLAGSTSQYTLFGRNLPGGTTAENLCIGNAPLQKLEVSIALPGDNAPPGQLSGGAAPLKGAWQEGIEFRLSSPHGPANPVRIYQAKAASVVLEQEPNNDSPTAQKIAVPCEYAGQFYPQRDIDWVQFEAKKGQTYWIEVISSQLGLDSDPFFALYRITKNDKGEEQLSEITQADDQPERNRRIGGEFDATSDDPAYKFAVPEDGTYRLMVRDQFGDSRKDPSFVYRLAIRPPDPDFRLLAYPSPPPPTQQNQNQTPLASACVRKGGTVAVAAVVQRRDDFDGEIAVSVEGLPPGVTCVGAVLGGNVDEGSLVLLAGEEAAAWAGPVKVVGRARIGDREVVREARYAVVVWGTPNRQQQAAEFRLAASLQLGVIDKEAEPALVRVGEDKVYETAVGGNIEIPITITRRGDFREPLKLVAVGLPQQMRPKDLTLDGSKTDGKLELQLNQQNLRPGAYTFYLKGEAKRKYSRNPDAVAAAEAEQTRVGEMMKNLAEDLKTATAAKDQATKTEEERAAAEATVKALQDKLKQAEQLKTQAEKRVSDAKQANQPKDVNLALVSTPIRLRIHASPVSLAVAEPVSPIKPGAKQELLVKVDRRFGFADQLELTLESPEGVQGLSAEKVTVKKDNKEGPLTIVAGDNATPGQHACTLRARGRFNNIQFESTAAVTINVESK